MILELTNWSVALVPVLLWAGFNCAFIASLRPQAAEAQRALPGELRA